MVRHRLRWVAPRLQRGGGLTCPDFENQMSGSTHWHVARHGVATTVVPVGQQNPSRAARSRRESSSPSPPAGPGGRGDAGGRQIQPGSSGIEPAPSAPPTPSAASCSMDRARSSPLRGRTTRRAFAHLRFAIDPSCPRFYTRRYEPVAQMVEHLTFNQVVLGSSPSGLTMYIEFL